MGNMAKQLLTELEEFGKANDAIHTHKVGWAHYQESRDTVKQAFAKTKMNGSVRWLKPGTPEVIDSPSAGQSQAGGKI